MTKHDQVMNAYVIDMRRKNVRAAISSLRFYRMENYSKALVLSVELRVKETYSLYRQTMKVLA